MIKFLTIVSLIVTMALMGCSASDKQMTAYYNTIDLGNTAIIETVEKQSAEIRAQRTEQMKFFGTAMVEASKTPDPTDNAVIAFAWGYQAATPLKLEIPSIKFPAAPVTDVDRVRAWTPIVGLAMPLVTPLIYGWSDFGNGGDSQSIQATDNATIYLDSGNAGSNNIADNQSMVDASGTYVDNQHDDYVAGNDITVNGIAGEEGGVGGQGTPENPVEGECTTDGYMNPVTGKWYTDATENCSCGSNAAGEC